MNTILMNEDEIKNAFNKLLSLPEEDENEVDAKILVARFLSEIQRVMIEMNISKTELAKSIGTSASFITQLFRGDKLINFKTLAKIQKTLDLTFQVQAKSNRSLIDENKIQKMADYHNRYLLEQTKRMKTAVELMKSGQQIPNELEEKPNNNIYKLHNSAA
ncbi:MAG: helix-turn-helix domain-containing protein [Bacteroidia bacterium]